MSVSYEDFYEIASQHFLTKPLTTEATEWSDVGIEIFIEENITEAYEGWYWADVYAAIDDVATANWYMYKRSMK